MPRNFNHVYLFKRDKLANVISLLLTILYIITFLDYTISLSSLIFDRIWNIHILDSSES